MTNFKKKVYLKNNNENNGVYYIKSFGTPLKNETDNLGEYTKNSLFTIISEDGSKELKVFVYDLVDIDGFYFKNHFIDNFNLDENKLKEVDPILYYKDFFSDWFIDIKTIELNEEIKKMNLPGNLNVIFYKTDVLYEADEDDIEYDKFPLYIAAVIDSDNNIIDGSLSEEDFDVKEITEELFEYIRNDLLNDISKKENTLDFSF